MPYHHSSGEITRRMKWNEQKQDPYVFINSNKIKELSLGSEVTIETVNSSSVFKIEDCGNLPFDIPEDIIAVPVHYPQSRKLFFGDSGENGTISPGAEKARIRK